MADLKLLLTIPEAIAGQPALAISSNRNYKETVINPITGEEIPNPVTRLQVAAGVLMSFVKEEMIAYYVPDLAKADRQAKIDEIKGFAITIQVVP